MSRAPARRCCAHAPPVPLAQARQATHIRFTGGDDTTDDDRLGPECQHSAEGRRLGHIAKVQRLFEESAGLLDLLMTQGSQCGVLDQTSYPELDSAFCRTLKLTFLGCAQVQWRSGTH